MRKVLIREVKKFAQQVLFRERLEKKKKTFAQSLKVDKIKTQIYWF